MSQNPFETAIENYLTGRGEQDPLFAETLKKEKKSIKECCSYIMSEVRKKYNGSAVAVPDAEVFNMAVHYYDEDDIVVDKPVQAHVAAPRPATPSSERPQAPAAPVVKKVTSKPAPVNQTSLF